MKLAIYDFDGTLVYTNSLPLLYKRWKTMGLNERSRRPIWRRIMIRYIFHKLNLFGWDKRKFNPYTMEQTADLFRSVDRNTLDSFLTVHYEQMLQFIPKVILDQIKQDKAEGYHTVLLSGNFDIILEPFRQVGFDSVIGTTSCEDGELLPSNQVEVIIQEGKADAIRHHFKTASLEDSKAYADSCYDIPILELVGQPTAVNPDHKLREFAIRHNWNIIDTKK